MENSDTSFTHKRNTMKITIKENIRVPIIQQEEEKEGRNVYSLQRIHATTNYVSEYDKLYKDVDKKDYLDDLMKVMHNKYDAGKAIDRTDQCTQTDIHFDDDVIKTFYCDDRDDREFEDIYSTDDEFHSASSEYVKEGLDLNEANNMMTETKLGIRTDQLTGEVLLIFYDQKGESEAISIGKGLVDDITISVNPRWGKKAEVVVKDENKDVIYPLPVVLESKELPEDFTEMKDCVQAYEFFLEEYDDSDESDLNLVTDDVQGSPNSSNTLICFESGAGEIDKDKSKTQKSVQSIDERIPSSLVKHYCSTQTIETEIVDTATQCSTETVEKSLDTLKPTTSDSVSVLEDHESLEKKDSTSQTEKSSESVMMEVSDKETMVNEREADTEHVVKKSSVLDALLRVQSEMKPLKNQLDNIQRQMREIDSRYPTTRTSQSDKPPNKMVPTASRQRGESSNVVEYPKASFTEIPLAIPSLAQAVNEISQQRKMPQERQIRRPIPLSKIKEPIVTKEVNKLLSEERLTETSIWTEPEDDSNDDKTEKHTKSKKKK